MGLLGSPALALPLVEARGRYDAAARAERGAEGRLVAHPLGAGIDHLVADRRVLGPGRDQAPAHARELALGRAVGAADDREFATRLVAHDGHALARGDVEPERQIARGLGELGDAESTLEQAGIGAKEVAT